MKKIKLLLPLMTVVASTSTLSSLLSSCNNGQKSYKQQAEQITEEAIKEFFDICKVPHFSYKLDKIRAYYKKWIEDNGFTYNCDSYGNIWFDVPATTGYENYKRLIIQCHMDMVFDCSDKTKTEEDITEIVPVRDGDLIHTKDYYTSLGADNSAGIGVMLAIAKSKDLAHGPIRMLITADEEEGMIGASKLAQETIGVINADYLINIDAEDEDQMVVSNAGGANWAYDVVKFDNEDLTELTPAETKDNMFQFKISKCKGGHSGDGPKKGNMNPVQQMAKLLMTSQFINNETSKICITNADTPGVTVGNKIPNEAVIQFYSSDFTLKQLQDIINPWFSELKTKFPVENEMTCEVSQLTNPTENTTMLTAKATYGILNMTNSFQTDYEFMDEGKTTLKSSGNIAPFILNLKAEGTKTNPQFTSTNWTRSVDDKKLEEQATKGDATYTKLKTYVKGATEINKKSTYPAWWPKKTNFIIDTYKKGLELAGGKPQYQDIHGGVEVSWWNKIRPDINQTSVGPQIDNAHNCKETFHISTYTKMIQAILYVIDNLK